MKNDETFELRDSRNGFLWIENSFFDALATRIKPSSLLVYLALARRANNNSQECYPSYDELKRMTGLSRQSVASALQELRENGVIDWKLEGRKNRYALLDTTSLKNRLVQNRTPTSLVSLPNQSSTLDANKTNNKTKEQDSILDSSKTESSSEFSLSESSLDNRPKKRQTDSRTADFRNKLIRFWDYLNKPKTLYWTGGDGKQLYDFLKQNPEMTLQEFHDVLCNYEASQNIVPPRKPHQFLPSLNLYFDGPLNKFGKPMEERRA
jgi:biotin operon repressor